MTSEGQTAHGSERLRVSPGWVALVFCSISINDNENAFLYLEIHIISIVASCFAEMRRSHMYRSVVLSSGMSSTCNAHESA